jgi:hypothetical protein
MPAMADKGAPTLGASIEEVRPFLAIQAWLIFVLLQIERHERRMTLEILAARGTEP